MEGRDGAVASALHPEGKPLSVFLGLKRLRWEEPNIAPSDGLSNNSAEALQHKRFSIYERGTPDLFAEESRESSLKYLVHEVHILFGEEVAHDQDYELVKVAELLRAAEGQGAVLSSSTGE